MVLYRIYYLMIDRPSKNVNIIWKALHLSTETLAALTGILNTRFFYTILHAFGHNCPLYAEINFERLHPSSVGFNIIPKNVSISLRESVWGSDMHCQYSFTMWIVSFISALILGTFFFWSKSGGAGDNSDSFVQPWKHVFPSLIVSIVLSLMITIAAYLNSNGIDYFCNEFTNYLHTPRCNSDINLFAIRFVKRSVRVYEAIIVLRYTIPLCVIAWLAHTAVLIIRMCMSPDFDIQIVKIIGMKKTPPNRYLPDWKRFPSTYTGIRGSLPSLHGLYFPKMPHLPIVRFADTQDNSRRQDSGRMLKNLNEEEGIPLQNISGSNFQDENTNQSGDKEYNNETEEKVNDLIGVHTKIIPIDVTKQLENTGILKQTYFATQLLPPLSKTLISVDNQDLYVVESKVSKMENVKQKIPEPRFNLLQENDFKGDNLNVLNAFLPSTTKQMIQGEMKLGNIIQPKEIKLGDIKLAESKSKEIGRNVEEIALEKIKSEEMKSEEITSSITTNKNDLTIQNPESQKSDHKQETIPVQSSTSKEIEPISNSSKEKNSLTPLIQLSANSSIYATPTTSFSSLSFDLNENLSNANTYLIQRPPSFRVTHEEKVDNENLKQNLLSNPTPSPFLNDRSSLLSGFIEQPPLARSEPLIASMPSELINSSLPIRYRTTFAISSGNESTQSEDERSTENNFDGENECNERERRT